MEVAQTYYAPFPELAGIDSRFNAQVSNLLAQNVLEVAHDISKTVLQNSQAKTEVFSPLSIYAALSLLLLGANGNTYQELLQAMHLNSDSYLAQNPWKIHEEFSLLIEDIIRDTPNPMHPRQQENWKLAFNSRVEPIRGVQSYRPNDGHEIDHKISVANGIFVQNDYSLRPDYRSAVLGIYQSNIKNLDFAHDAAQSTKYINEYVQI